MSSLALIIDGVIAQIDPAEFPVVPAWTWVDVTSVTPTPQVGWVATETGGAWTFTAPAAPIQTLAQGAAAAVNAGLSISLSGSITLAATVFSTDAVTTGKIGAVITTLATTNAFPGGGTSYPMKDATGAWHTFAEAQYKAVAAAIATYVASLDLIVDGNPMSATALPASAVTLTV